MVISFMMIRYITRVSRMITNDSRIVTINSAAAIGTAIVVANVTIAVDGTIGSNIIGRVEITILTTVAVIMFNSTTILCGQR